MGHEPSEYACVRLNFEPGWFRCLIWLYGHKIRKQQTNEASPGVTGSVDSTPKRPSLVSIQLCRIRGESMAESGPSQIVLFVRMLFR